jgi:hypothetical protein
MRNRGVHKGIIAGLPPVFYASPRPRFVVSPPLPFAAMHSFTRPFKFQLSEAALSAHLKLYLF